MRKDLLINMWKIITNWYSDEDVVVISPENSYGDEENRMRFQEELWNQNFHRPSVKLSSINIISFRKFTDIVVSAIAHNCPNLENIINIL